MILYRISYHSHDFHIFNNISWNYITARYLLPCWRVVNSVNCFTTHLSSRMLFRLITLNCIGNTPFSRCLWLNWFTFFLNISKKSYAFHMLHITQSFGLMELFFIDAWFYLLVCRGFTTSLYFSKGIFNVDYYLRLTFYHDFSVLI